MGLVYPTREISRVVLGGSGGDGKENVCRGQDAEFRRTELQEVTPSSDSRLLLLK